MKAHSQQDSLKIEFNPDEGSSPNYEDAMIGTKRVFRCLHPDCGKTFRFRSEMVRHLTTHSDKRAFVCNYPGCHKSFKRPDALTNHYRIHTETTPYVCRFPGCTSKFTSKASINYHTLKHGEKNFVCSFAGCDRAFATYAQVQQHEKAYLYHQKNITQDSVIKGLMDFNETSSTGKYQFEESPQHYGSIGSLSPQIVEANNNIFKAVSQNKLAPEETQNYVSTLVSATELAKQSKEECPILELVTRVFEENKQLQKQLQETETLLGTLKQNENIEVDSFFNPSLGVKTENPEEQNLDYSFDLNEFHLLR